MYIGRFAPSPTGPLHPGSLVAALASWLDARAHAGRWLVRIEDVDTSRCIAGADQLILRQLATCGLVPDEPPVWQSRHGARYEVALERLVAAGLAYPCACSRRAIAEAQAGRGVLQNRGQELPYPGTCRPERGGLHGRAPRTWRFHTQKRDLQNGCGGGSIIRWDDRRLGRQQQDVALVVGDFVLRRADGLWAYQLAVVVDDAAQGVTHVVRGEDLADNTARQILLQRALGLPAPAYLHTPLVRGGNGEKLSKQNGASPIDLTDPKRALIEAASVLGLRIGPSMTVTTAELMAGLVGCWRAAMQVR